MSDHPNTLRGEFTLTLGATVLTLRPTFDNLARAEAGVGRSILALAGDLATGGRGITMNEWVTLLHALVAEPRPSRNTIAEMVMEAGQMELAPMIVTLVERVSLGSRKRPVPSAEGNGETATAAND